MKLRNKKTGEIGELQITEKHCGVAYGNGTASCGIEIYSSLAELNEEWEDYEESTGYWYIDFDGDVLSCVEDFDEETDEKRKSIGNYFETKEEAERAVEKLKAWKRLKDKGFVWQDWEEVPMGNGMCVIGCQIPENNWETDVVEDLDLLFSGEDD